MPLVTNKAILIYPTIYEDNKNINKYHIKEKETNHIVTATVYLGKDLQKEKEILIKRLSEILNQAIN